MTHATIDRRLPRLAVMALFTATIPAANWLIGNVGTVCIPDGPCLIPVGFGLMAPSGVLMIGIALVLRDWLHELAGWRWALMAILIGGALSLLVSPPSLALASAVAFTLAEVMDLAVYARLRARGRAEAVFASQIVGAAMDSVLFVLIAFGSFDLSAGNFLGKLYAGAAVGAVSALAARSEGNCMIHYHGTPITPHGERAKMAGKHFCVSYAHPADADWCLTHGQSVMWDNGAFSAFKSGRPIDPQAFAKWVDPRLAPPHWAVIPDVIDGGVEEQRAMIYAWPHEKELSAPVWHMALPIDWLLELVDRWPRVCFGSSGAYWQVGSEAWERRADEAWNAIARRGLRPWVHMMRGLSLCGDRWPFASADSVNVALNFKGSKSRGLASVCPERMARVIDGRQCPIHWAGRPEQPTLFDMEATS